MKLFSLFLLCVFLRNVSSNSNDSVTQENRPTASANQENRPTDSVAQENRPTDSVTQENRPTDSMTCQVSHLKDLLSFSKTGNKQIVPEKCWISEHVKSLLDAMGKLGHIIENIAHLNYSCFTVTVNVRFGRDWKYRGCMPQGLCKIVENVFKLIKATGGITKMVTKLLFKGATCAECYGDMCNTPVQKRHLITSDLKLSCEVSDLKQIIHAGNIEDMSYKPDVCIMSEKVKSLLSRFENEGKIVPINTTLGCFTLKAKTTADGKDVTVLGCAPKGDCQIVEKIFTKIPTMDNNNQTISLFKEAKCQECKGDMCNAPILPKAEQAIAPLAHLSSGLIFTVLVRFLI